MAEQRSLQVRELGEIVMRAEVHLPNVAGAPADGIAAEGFVGSGRSAFADQDEAVKAGGEVAAEIHAVELDVCVGDIDLIVAGDEDSDLVGLAHAELVTGRLRPGLRQCSGKYHGEEREDSGKPGMHTFSVSGWSLWAQYNRRESTGAGR